MSCALPPLRIALLLDEMHAPVVASALRTRGHDVVAVVDDVALRTLADEELFAFAVEHGRRVVTENVKDFRRLLLRAEEAGHATAGVLFTSSRSFPRSRQNPGPLHDALDAWLHASDAEQRPCEDWLVPPGGHQ